MSYKGRQLFIRPEKITISSTTSDALKGIIERITYYGSYYILHVITGRQTVKVKANDNSYAEGDVIYLDIKAGDVWNVQT